MLRNCTLTGNTQPTTEWHSLCRSTTGTLTGNSAYGDGGGAFSGTLKNCTLSANSASYGGGVFSGTLDNCIVYYNTGPLLRGQSMTAIPC